jgi:hypothetical protein
MIPFGHLLARFGFPGMPSGRSEGRGWGSPHREVGPAPVGVPVFVGIDPASGDELFVAVHSGSDTPSQPIVSSGKNGEISTRAHVEGEPA